MKLHKNASLTLKNRQQLKELYATGRFTQVQLATRFGVSRKTISKWVHRSSIEDQCPLSKKPTSITADFIAAVKAYGNNEATRHHGKIRIALALEEQFACCNPSNVYLVLKQAKLNQVKSVTVKKTTKITLGKYRTQMDIQQLPAIAGNEGFEYKISIIHLSTRVKYSEIHPSADSQTIAAVYQRALENLPPFL